MQNGEYELVHPWTHFLGSLLNELASSSVRIHGNLSPEWAEIFIIDHSESDNWTQLKVSIFDCRRSVKDEGSHAGGATVMASGVRALPSFVGSSRHDPVM